MSKQLSKRMNNNFSKKKRLNNWQGLSHLIRGGGGVPLLPAERVVDPPGRVSRRRRGLVVSVARHAVARLEGLKNKTMQRQHQRQSCALLVFLNIFHNKSFGWGVCGQERGLFG